MPNRPEDPAPTPTRGAALEPDEDARLDQILDAVIDSIISIVTAPDAGRREQQRPVIRAQMREFRKLIVRNVRYGVSGPDQE